MNCLDKQFLIADEDLMSRKKREKNNDELSDLRQEP
jgi:hypothetical protein